MAGLTARFEAALASSGLTNERVLVAVSGGIDSTTLLSLVCSLRGQLSLDVHVAHVDHGLRDESADDAAFVKHLSNRYCAPFHTARLDVRGHARKMGCGIEAAARRLRYEFLAETATRIGAGAVLTGHTADDQIETVLMSIARGGSTGALAGIPRQRNLTEGVRVLRPLLDIHRADVENFARENGLEWVEDATNQEHVFLRNRVRHVLLPQMNAVLGPGIGANILRMAQTMEQLHSIVEQLADSAEYSLVTVRDEAVLIDTEQLLRVPGLVKDAVLKRHLHLNIAGRERLLELAKAEVGTQASLSGGLYALRERNHITVFFQDAVSTQTGPFDIDIRAEHKESTYQIGEQSLSIRRTETGDESVNERSRNCIAIDVDKINGTLRCRPWQRGDRIHPEGMSGSKLVSDVLTDAKIPHSMRRNIHVIVDGEGILWICGLRQSRRAAITDSTVRCLLCRIEPGIASD